MTTDLAPRSSRRASGFTLIEVMVTVALMTSLMTVAATGWVNWSRASAHRGVATDIQSVLRQTQQRAVTEASSLCVLFDTTADTWRLYRGRCDSTTKTALPGSWSTGSKDLHVSYAQFVPVAGGTSPGVTFTSRGTATPGEVRVTRQGSSTVHRVVVEGLTGRVSTH
ncbi:GspH/FimT family pseudopilin [Nocardioides sp.]|uniref:GspH/FimT family pseudopilin n=1 Tax=Nocardioides sp. TaxID=35761 RepID=UPI00356A055C